MQLLNDLLKITLGIATLFFLVIAIWHDDFTLRFCSFFMFVLSGFLTQYFFKERIL